MTLRCQLPVASDARKPAEEKQRIRSVQKNVCGVHDFQVESEELNLCHVGDPNQRMPIRMVKPKNCLPDSGRRKT